MHFYFLMKISSFSEMDKIEVLFSLKKGVSGKGGVDTVCHIPLLQSQNSLKREG